MRENSEKSGFLSESSQRSTTKNASQVLLFHRYPITQNSPIARTGTKLESNCQTENAKSTGPSSNRSKGNPNNGSTPGH